MSDQPPSIFSKGASGLSIFSNFGKTDGKKDEEKK